MATVSQQRLHDLQQYLWGLEPGGDYWLDAKQKFNLRKLGVGDLVAHGVGERQAEKAVAALQRHDTSGLAQALGVRFRAKFKMWAEREGSMFKFTVEGGENADWLRDYVRTTVPSISISEAVQESNGRYYGFTVTCGDSSALWRIERVMKNCPAIIAMEMPVVRIVERPHYRLEASELATWIDRQREDVWWSVDGDPLLMGQLDLPCPPDELSAALRSTKKVLLVDDPDDCAKGDTLTAQEIDRALTVDRFGRRELFLTWEGDTEDWELSEAEELTEELR